MASAYPTTKRQFIHHISYVSCKQILAQCPDSKRNLQNDLLYRVAHKKRPQLCNDAVRLNSRIQTKRNDSFKQQS